VVAPRPVEGGRHPLAPRPGERRSRLGHENGVALRGPAFSGSLVGYRRLGTDDEGLLEEIGTERHHKDGVDVGVDPAVLAQGIQAHEVGVVRIPIRRGTAPIE